ncbi:Hpt domain-containing protein [Anaerovibrio sp. RM50]|uniref:Hpt domain-containing protein n=1 Tax=Anaerovibrio sp. RM50 TaxID=1200557 RepID=UPI0006847085|nr:Hpt domain-containing protein [Anaerovibrio sp. RM50]
MSALTDTLKSMGCGIDEAMARFLNNEAFYEKCFKKFLDDTVFEGLGAALSTNSVEDGFSMAHNLKGVSANLGITPMYEIVAALTEELRAGNMPADAMDRYNEILKMRDDLKRLV